MWCPTGFGEGDEDNGSGMVRIKVCIVGRVTEFVRSELIEPGVCGVILNCSCHTPEAGNPMRPKHDSDSKLEHRNGCKRDGNLALPALENSIGTQDSRHLKDADEAHQS